MPVAGSLPPGVRLVQLPPVRVADASFAPLRDASLDPIDDAFRERRRTLLLEAFEAAQPSVVMTETFPFGRRALRFELIPLLERVASCRPRIKLLASVRDILQRQARPEREQEMLEQAGGSFGAVLVHGDERLATFADSFSAGAPLELAPPVHYTGFVGVRAPRESARERNEIVVSAGGGAVGEKLLAAAVDAQPLSRFAALTWRILAGPNLPDAAFERLRSRASSRVVVERSRSDLTEALEVARVSISQAGYNTALDVATSGARAVLVPFAEEGQTEQAMRAERLAAHDLAIVVDERNLGPATLAKAVDEAGTRRHWGRWDFASDGARRTAEIVLELLDNVRRATA
jgi:predicted glycosyltransferase